jgi:hypothetical protein
MFFLSSMDASQPITAAANQPDTQGWRREAASAPDRQVRLAELQLMHLARMRDVGMALLDDLDEERDRPIEKRASVFARAQSFDKITRAIRQIMALEQEVIGLREKRVKLVDSERSMARRSEVRRSVEKSLTAAKPQLDRQPRERLLHDLFADYKKFATGSIPELIESICKDLGIPADLTLWEEPNHEDIVLPAGFDWVVPVNGDKPYKLVETQGDTKVRRPFDSPLFNRHGDDPPDG